MKRVVIAGAGIAGLATALRMHRAGWEPLVVERSPGRRSSGYLVNLIGSGYDAAERLGILEALQARALGPFTTIIVDASGRRKFAMPPGLAESALGGRTLTVFRGDLEAALFEAVEPLVEMRFGRSVVGAVELEGDGGVRVELDDGSVECAELLVGADGLHSSVRRAVFGPEESYRVDLRHLVAAFPLDRTPAGIAAGSGTTFIGPGRTAAIVDLGPGRSCAFFTWRSEDVDAELAAGPTAALAARFGDLGGGVPAALDELARDEGRAYVDAVAQIVAPAWSRGRVVLLGDAAWCVTLFAGFGAALALGGADRLGAVLERSYVDLRTALESWEAALRPEAERRQAFARKGIARFAPPTRAHVVANELVLRTLLLPGVRALVQRGMRAAAR